MLGIPIGKELPTIAVMKVNQHAKAVMTHFRCLDQLNLPANRHQLAPEYALIEKQRTDWQDLQLPIQCR